MPKLMTRLLVQRARLLRRSCCCLLAHSERESAGGQPVQSIPIPEQQRRHWFKFPDGHRPNNQNNTTHATTGR
jgi:hypothetical protein